MAKERVFFEAAEFIVIKKPPSLLMAALKNI